MGGRWRQPRRHGTASRFDRRFYAVGTLVLVAAVAGKVLGLDDFRTYPSIEIGFGAGTAALCALVVLAGLAPWRRGGTRG